jgi:hypothetical protein
LPRIACRTGDFLESERSIRVVQYKGTHRIS